MKPNCIDCNKVIDYGHKRCKSCSTKLLWKEGKYKNRPKKFGEKNNYWKGGKVKGGKGYIYVLSPTHPNKNNSCYVMEHRLVIENKIGRLLSSKEVVHHINHIKTDNREENLLLFTDDIEHRKYHKKEKNRGTKN